MKQTTDTEDATAAKIARFRHEIETVLKPQVRRRPNLHKHRHRIWVLEEAIAYLERTQNDNHHSPPHHAPNQ